MKKRDPKFERKMPVNFYGKVVDQAGQPVRELMSDSSGQSRRLERLKSLHRLTLRGCSR